MEVYVETLNKSPRDILVKNMSYVYLKGDTITKQKNRKDNKTMLSLPDVWDDGNLPW